MNPRETVGDRLELHERHWINEEIKDTNPALIVAKILIDRGLCIAISQAMDRFGRRVPGRVNISAPRSLKPVLIQIELTHEYNVLSNALGGIHPPLVENCRWDEETKKRVLAFYYESESEFHKEKAEAVAAAEHPHSRSFYEEESQRAQSKARELLGELNPLTLADVHSLFEQVVDGELAPTSG
jgi:hypothetical protein